MFNITIKFSLKENNRKKKSSNGIYLSSNKKQLIIFSKINFPIKTFISKLVIDLL